MFDVLNGVATTSSASLDVIAINLYEMRSDQIAPSDLPVTRCFVEDEKRESVTLIIAVVFLIIVCVMRTKGYKYCQCIGDVAEVFGSR